jgi:hypothetical protein
LDGLNLIGCRPNGFQPVPAYLMGDGDAVHVRILVTHVLNLSHEQQRIPQVERRSSPQRRPHASVRRDNGCDTDTSTRSRERSATHDGDHFTAPQPLLWNPEVTAWVY